MPDSEAIPASPTRAEAGPCSVPDAFGSAPTSMFSEADQLRRGRVPAAVADWRAFRFTPGRGSLNKGMSLVTIALRFALPPSSSAQVWEIGYARDG